DQIGFFIAMEFLRGKSLEEVFEDCSEIITLRFLLSAFRQICDAMGCAHARGIFHRDLKPDNLFLVGQPFEYGQEPLIKVLDFGVAKMVASEEDERLTRTGMTIGTPRYMSPEQAGEGNTDHRSDIYSLAVILFECLTGHPPFEGSSAYQIMLRHVYADPPKLHQVRPELMYPQELERLVESALAKSPLHRPPSMDLFWHQLEDSLVQFMRVENPDAPLLVASPHRKEEKVVEEEEEPPLIVGRMVREQPLETPNPSPPSSDNALVSIYNNAGGSPLLENFTRSGADLHAYSPSRDGLSMLPEESAFPTDSHDDHQEPFIEPILKSSDDALFASPYEQRRDLVEALSDLDPLVPLPTSVSTHAKSIPSTQMPQRIPRSVPQSTSMQSNPIAAYQPQHHTNSLHHLQHSGGMHAGQQGLALKKPGKQFSNLSQSQGRLEAMRPLRRSKKNVQPLALRHQEV
ncbi:MAG: serine/threonine-protein kinase, partial [Myxococcota bacterium]